MVPNNTPLAGLLGIVVVIAMIGVVSGVAISGTDLLNFNTSAAEARILEMDAELQSKKDAIDLQYYEAIQAARTESEKEALRLELKAQKDGLEQELAHQRAQDELDLALARPTRYVVLAVGTLAALIVSVGLAVFLIQYGRSRLVSAQAEATHAQAAPWDVYAWRAEQVRRAREREIADRMRTMGQQTTREPDTGGNGKHPPKDKLGVR
jgi:hypothetical protein